MEADTQLRQGGTLLPGEDNHQDKFQSLPWAERGEKCTCRILSGCAQKLGQGLGFLVSKAAGAERLLLTAASWRKMEGSPLPQAGPSITSTGYPAASGPG